MENAYSKNVGCSSDTKLKQDHLKKLLSMHVRLTRKVIERNSYLDRAYHYIDLNAGSGRTVAGEGSPLIFLNIANHFQLNYKAIFVEKEKKNIETLRSCIKYPCTIVEGDHGDNWVMKQYIDTSKPRLGLLYHDPNGAVSFDALAQFTRHPHNRKMDILISMSATLLKRVSGAYKTGFTLEDGLNRLHKSHWKIRYPVGRWQRTLLIGTQWKGFPELKRQGFVDIDSKKGLVVFEKLNLTNNKLKEKYDKQIPMFSAPPDQLSLQF